MRPDDEENPLDLNNLPEDHYAREGKQVVQDTSSGRYRKKKSGAKDGKVDDGKVYECRFCSLKFCKSQALGGHMNRHRQDPERETEQLNRARELVFNSDNLAAPPPPHLGCCHPISPGGYHHHHHHPGAAGNNIVADPTIPLRYPPRMFSAGSSSSTLMPPPPPPQAGVQVQPPQPYLYSSPSRPISYSSPASSHYPHHQHSSVNDYYVGHVLSSTTSTPSQYGHGQPTLNYGAPPESTNYTCIGAPVGPGGGVGAGGGGGGGSRDVAVQRLDAPPLPPPSMNRFQHGF